MVQMGDMLIISISKHVSQGSEVTDHGSRCLLPMTTPDVDARGELL